VGTYDSFGTIKGKALIVTVSALQHMEEVNRPLRGKEFLQPAQDMLAAFELPLTKMVFISNVLSKLAEAGHICKTTNRLYFMTEAQAVSFNLWLSTPAYKKQLTDTLAGVKEYYRLKAGGEERTPTLAELRELHAKGKLSTTPEDLNSPVESFLERPMSVEPAPDLPAVFELRDDGRCSTSERGYVRRYQDFTMDRAYLPPGWTLTFTSPKGVEFTFDKSTGRLIRLSDGKFKTVYSPEES
jgi:hypothetical protein